MNQVTTPIYHLGPRSERNLVGVVQPLQDVTRLGITYTLQDFCVFEGVRSKTRQIELVRTGASRTLNSRHLTGHAVDLVAWIGGQASWSERPHYVIAEAMHRAGTELGIVTRWGGCWDRMLGDLDPDDLAGEAHEYVKRCKAQGIRAFLDLVHHEIPEHH